MEQNFKYQQELQQQGYLQTTVDFETQEEAEMRYQRFLLEEMNRQALLSKNLQSSAQIANENQENEDGEEKSCGKCGKYCGKIFICIFISSFILAGVFAIYQICSSVFYK